MDCPPASTRGDSQDHRHRASLPPAGPGRRLGLVSWGVSLDLGQGAPRPRETWL